MLYCTHIDLNKALLPHILKLLQFLSKSCRTSSVCRDANNTLFHKLRGASPLPKLMVGNRVGEGVGGEDSGKKGGWQPLKCGFEEDEIGYETDDDRNYYHSLSSGNTCAVANVCFFGNDKAAWEFELLHDTYGDECSVFGAARRPISSRCYSSSPDLWMRRAYNGYMYSQGRSVTLVAYIKGT